MASAAPVGAKPAAATFFERLEAGVAAKDSLLCVGLDPHARDLPGGATADAAVSFCTRIVEATSAVAVAYKPNAAFFEALGADGVAALKTVSSNTPVLCSRASSGRWCISAVASSSRSHACRIRPDNPDPEQPTHLSSTAVNTLLT